MWVRVRTWVQRLEETRELELHAGVSHPMWVLGTNLDSSPRAVSTLNATALQSSLYTHTQLLLLLLKVYTWKVS